jgi:hypothetical protein
MGIARISLRGKQVHVNPYTRQLLRDPDYTEILRATKPAISAGAGVKIRIASRLSLRPELRLLTTTPGAGINWEYLRFSAAIGYHF